MIFDLFSKRRVAFRCSELLDELADGFSLFEQFDARLAMHLQGLVQLHDFVAGEVGPTYRDVLLRVAQVAETSIAGMDRTRLLQLGRALAEQLES